MISGYTAKLAAFGGGDQGGQSKTYRPQPSLHDRPDESAFERVPGGNDKFSLPLVGLTFSLDFVGNCSYEYGKSLMVKSAHPHEQVCRGDT
ncbi:MAG: hypothetical protein AB7G75_28180 [Candidatus Binatia bacterium]